MTRKPTGTSVSEHLPLRPVEFVVLAALQDEAMHGYGLVQEIERRTDGQVRVRPGDLYRVLYRLANRELIEQAAAGTNTNPGDDRRSYYQITDLGIDVVRAEANILSKVAAGVMRASEAKVS